MRRLTDFETFAKAVLPGVLALGILGGCASTPREVASQPVPVRLNGRTVSEIPGLQARLVTYSDQRTALLLNPHQQWDLPRMSRPELQEMVEQCRYTAGRSVLQLQEAVLEDAQGAVLADFLDGGSQPWDNLARISGREVRAPAGAAGAALRMKVDPDRFYGQLREEIEPAFRDAEAQVAPGVHATVESMTTDYQSVDLGYREARVHYLYVKLDNRSEHSYSLNGGDTGAMEAGADRMLTAESLDGSTIVPGRALMLRLPVEITQASLEPELQRSVELERYLSGWNGLIGPWVAAVVPLRVQIELQSDERDSSVQRGFLTPTLQVQKRYRVERAGCFDPVPGYAKALLSTSR